MPLYSNNSSVSISSNNPISTTATDIDVIITDTATQVLPVNNDRKSFAIYNQTSSDIYFDYSNGVTTTNFAFKLGAGDYYESSTSPVYQGTVYGIVGSGTASPQIRELI